MSSSTQGFGIPTYKWVLLAPNAGTSSRLRIPMKPATYSNFKPDGVPI